MVEKLLLSNDFLKIVTAIDPVAILAKRTVALKAILHLPDIVTIFFFLFIYFFLIGIHSMQG